MAWAIRAVNAEHRADREAAEAKAINDYLRNDLFGEGTTRATANKRLTFEEYLTRRRPNSRAGSTGNPRRGLAPAIDWQPLLEAR